jgi:hypothetical protein
MTHIFYFFAIFALFYEFLVLTDTKNASKFLINLENKLELDQEMSSTEKIFSRLMIGYGIWNFVGLFSSQWILFLILLLISIFSFKKYPFLLFIDALISFGLILFIILNKYHFHINIIKTLF